MFTIALNWLSVLALGVGLAVEPAREAEILTLGPKMEEFLESRVPGRVSPLDRVQILVDALFDQEGLDFQYDAGRTLTARDTFLERTGNCLSFSMMFVAMARHLGLNARFQEVETVPNWTRRGQAILFTQHVNVLVRIGPRQYEVDLIPRVNQVRIGQRVISDNRAFAHFYNNTGVGHFAREHLQLAETYFQKALQADPQTAFVWTNLGVVQVASGNFKEAEESYLKALQIDGQHMTAMDNLGQLYRRLGQMDKAEHYAKKVQKFRAKNPYHHYRLGEAAYARDDFQEAIQHYREAVKLKFEEYRFHLALARAHAELGQVLEVEKNLQQAMKLAPEGVWESHYQGAIEKLLPTN